MVEKKKLCMKKLFEQDSVCVCVCVNIKLVHDVFPDDNERIKCYSPFICFTLVCMPKVVGAKKTRRIEMLVNAEQMWIGNYDFRVCGKWEKWFAQR